MLIPSDRLDEERSILDRIRRGEVIENYETVRQRKDGTRFDISLTVSPIKNEQGQIVGASKISRDITEHKRLEAAQQANNARFETLFNSSPVGIYLVDAEMRFRLVNQKPPGLRQHRGADRQRLCRSRPPRVASAGADEIVAQFRHTLETGEPYTSSGFSGATTTRS